jgi:dephospho-CoA kinase
MVSDLGARAVLDADAVTHRLMASGQDLTAAISVEFGTGVLGGDGAVDRRRLGDIVFGDPSALRRLEALVHPEVRHFIESRIMELRRERIDGIVAVEAIRLLDSPVAALADAIWLVVCTPSVQTDRLVRARGYSASDAERRIGAGPLFDQADVTETIVNDSTLELLRDRVDEAWYRLFRVVG